VAEALGEMYLDGAASPAEEWALGGPIIERERITLIWARDNGWLAKLNYFPFREELGPTPLIAAMRAYVASKLGDEVDLP
jgi:hypothetical protein